MSCKVENCDKKPICKGMCQSHYDRLRRYGDVYTRPTTFTCAGCSQESTPNRTGNFPKYCAACMKDNHRVRIRKDRRRKGLWESYKMTPSEYQKMYDEQKGLCLICNQTTQGRGAKRNTLAVDHNHATGKIRGLLCIHCNSGLGYFRDNKDLLQQAIIYLDERD